MEWEMDLQDDTPETLERMTPALGWYNAKLFDLQEDDKGRWLNLIFRITGPTFAGALVEDKVWDPRQGNDDPQIAQRNQRAKAVMSRMGLITKDDTGKTKTVDWSQAIDKDFVIKVVDASYKNEKGHMVDKVGLPYIGMYPPNHPEIPPAERAKLGLPLLPGQELPTAAPATGEAPKTPGRKPRASKPAPTPPEELDVDSLVANLNL